MACADCCIKLLIDGPNRQDVLLTDANDDPIVGATVTATIFDLTGTPLPGISWPLDLDEIGAGVYRLDFDGNDLDVGPGVRAQLVVTSEVGALTATKSCMTITEAGALTCV